MLDERTWRLLFLSVVVFSLFVGSARGRVVEESFSQKQTALKFMAKFCYSDAGLGSMELTPKNIKNGTDLTLLVFDDTVWHRVFEKDLTCAQVRSIAQTSGNAAGVYQIEPHKTVKTSFSDKTRPRFWFFAVSRCEPGPIDFQFTLEMLNYGGHWAREFSYEDQGLGVLYLCYFIFYLLLFVLVMILLARKWRNGTFNTVNELFQLWSGLILLEMSSKFFMFIHEAVYADDGIGAPGVLGLGDVLEMCGRVLMVGLFSLMAKGYRLTTNYIHNKVLLICLFCAWALSYVAFYIWENIEDDDVYVRTTFESPPGIINLVLRCLIWLYFGFSVFRTIKRTDAVTPEELERTRRSGEVLHSYSRETKLAFYIPFSVLASVWFIMLPFMVVVSQGYAPYYRYKSILAVVYTLNFIIEFIVGAWLYPSRDGLELTNGRGIYFGLLPSRFETEHARLLSNNAQASVSASVGLLSSSDSEQELQYLNKNVAQSNARAFDPYNNL